ncbi:Six-hairpin glycosidase-like protein [Mycena filopes]|nr:Six-hairpin glycosidase-like protein [Mycena filopes]
MWTPLLASLYACAQATVYASPAPIDRHAVVARYNPTRTASSGTTPMQIGNGNFAFGADITGLQTFQPWAIMSTWGWKNDSLPPGKTLADVYDYTGISLDNHGREVEYMFNGEATMQTWMISNPNRVNLGAIGLVFFSDGGPTATRLNVTESNLTAVEQKLDLWTGTLTSKFTLDGVPIQVETVSAQNVDSIGVTISSPLLSSGRLGVFIDFPWNDGSKKFSDPFVGFWQNASIHTTTLDSTHRGSIGAEIAHTLVNNTFVTSIGGDAFTIARDSPAAHRYTIRPASNSSAGKFQLSTTWGLTPPKSVLSPEAISLSSSKTWEAYWMGSGFVDVFTGSTDPRADELQRRIILSRYLMRVNEAGDFPPQESGLVNDGWYGKFHLEMFFWHCQHWALWNNWDLLLRSSTVYDRFLATAIARAQVQQGWPAGARWGKMSDPSGRSAPGQINELLIWQQPHPLVFANYEYRAFPTRATLLKWEPVVRTTADWMAAFAWFNETTGVYDLGPPLYEVAEDNDYTNTYNPAFELAYWRLGLGIAEAWLARLGEAVPASWTTVKNGLAKLPVNNGTYKVFEDVNDDFWTDPTYINDHPALAGLHGWLPPTEGLDLETARLTTEKVWSSWNVSNVVATPYFPGSGGLLYAVAMMANGWDGSNGTAPGFPTEGWNVRAEGLSKAM